VKRFSILILSLVLISTVAHAQNRGPLPGIYASWASVEPGVGTTFTFPYNSRDVYIRNGSAKEVFIDLKGGTLPVTLTDGLVSTYKSISPTLPSVIALDSNSDLTLHDFVTGGITVTSSGSTASPVSVLVTY